MFDDLDIEKLEAEDAKREEVKKNFSQYGDDEVALAQMRDSFVSKNLEDNVKALAKLEEKVSELSDNKPLISEEVEKFAEEEKQVEENLETSTEELVEDKEEEVEQKTDVESEVKPTINDEWIKKEEEFNRRLKEQEELIIKMYTELQKKEQQVEQKVEQPKIEEPEPEVDLSIFDGMAKEVVEKLTYADEENAAKLLAKMVSEAVNKKQTKVIKQEVDEKKFEEWLAKKEQAKYEQQFNVAKQSFFETEEGKQILGNEDFFDLYQAKFVKLQNSGVHLNPEDLFKKAYESTAKVVGLNKTSSSTANKAVPKVSDSLKEDVSKVEETKKQAVKPTSSSNVGKPTDSKKFDPVDAYKQYLASIGQKL